jgi:MATE family multidrug resistance protein
MQNGTGPASERVDCFANGAVLNRSGLWMRSGSQPLPETIASHLGQTTRLAGPILMGHLSNFAITTTTLLLFGWLSSGSLAAAGLAIRVAVSTNVLAGILLVVGVAASGANGGRDTGRVAGLYWNGFFLTLALSVLSFAWMSVAPGLLAILGQPPEVVAEAETILHVLRWGEPANLLRLGLMRSMLPALGMTGILYALMPVSLLLYVITGIVLVSGLGELPPLGAIGIPIALVGTMWLTALAMLAAVHCGRSRSLIPFTRIRLALLREMIRSGLPIGTLQGADGIFFLIATVVIGQFGAAALAAHQIALNFGTIAYSLALSYGDAAALRISYRRGAHAFTDARVAGFVGIGMGTVSMAVAALVVLAMPNLFIGFFIDIADPRNAATLAASQSLVLFASLFIFADGIYGTGMGVLRGLGDNRYAMLVVIVAYWGIGLPVGTAYQFLIGFDIEGVWLGLGILQGLIGLVLVRRYAQITQRDSA